MKYVNISNFLIKSKISYNSELGFCFIVWECLISFYVRLIPSKGSRIIFALIGLNFETCSNYLKTFLQVNLKVYELVYGEISVLGSMYYGQNLKDGKLHCFWITFFKLYSFHLSKFLSSLRGFHRISCWYAVKLTLLGKFFVGLNSQN